VPLSLQPAITVMPTAPAIGSTTTRPLPAIAGELSGKHVPISGPSGHSTGTRPRDGYILLAASRKLTLLLALPALALLLPLFVIPFYGRRRYY
jgi:hypothetical protein